jgi:hypothetical protein
MTGRIDMTRIISMGIAILLLFSASAATAEVYQFKFLVPVNVKNLHPYAAKVTAPCGVKDAGGNFIMYDVAKSAGDKGTLDSTGSFSGTLSTSVKMFDPADAVKAKSYSCSIMIWNESSMGHVPEDCSDPMSIFYCLKPGTARTLKVEGPIP